MLLTYKNEITILYSGECIFRDIVSHPFLPTTSQLKNPAFVNSAGTLSVRSGKESFGFKKLLELVWTLVYVFQRSMKWFHAAANFAIAKQVNKIKLLYVCL